MKNQQQGFSLIEMLIVVVIIGIIAAISIPGFIASRRSANEGSTVSSLRVLHGAQMTYASTYGLGDFAGDVGGGTLAAFTTLSNLKLIDSSLGTGSKSSYTFVGGRLARSGTEAAQFYISAIPVSSAPIIRTGDHRYGISTEGVMKFDTTLTDHYADVAAVQAANTFPN